MAVRKIVDAAENQHRLDGFLCGLLRIEAKILQISACYAALRYRQIASRTIQPLPRIVGRKTLTLIHIPPFLPATQA